MPRENSGPIDWTKPLKYNCNDDLKVKVLGTCFMNHKHRILKLYSMDDDTIEYYMVVDEDGNNINGRDPYYYSVENIKPKTRTVWKYSYTVIYGELNYVSKYNYEGNAVAGRERMLSMKDTYCNISPIWREEVEVK